MSNSNIKDIQARFLDEMAMRGAIDASVRETNVYSNNKSDAQKSIAKKKWQTYIREIAKRYKVLRNRDDFISDVKHLQDMINNDQEINHLFCKLDKSGDIIADEYGIRIAQCQKSLSLYLKYLWCYGLIETPPVCPIDRVILSLCKSYYEKHTEIADRQVKIDLCSINWTRLDDINEYRQLVEITEEVAGSQICTAEWELVKWDESVISQTARQERKDQSTAHQTSQNRHIVSSKTIPIKREIIDGITVVQNTHEIVSNKTKNNLIITKGIELKYRNVPIIAYYGVDRSNGKVRQICKVSVQDEAHNKEELFCHTNILSLLDEGRKKPYYQYKVCATEADAQNIWKDILQELNIPLDIIASVLN